MMINCPNCNRAIDQLSPPVRGPVTDGSEGWLCLKCPAVVCSYPIMRPDGSSEPCYMDHMAKEHPGMYGLPTAALKKNKKDKKKKV